MSEHILFYSKRCPNCSKLFELLNRSPRLQNQFLSVCIDDRRFKVPKCIRSVPSAIIPSPTGEPQVFSGTNLFNWVKKRLPMQAPPPNGGRGDGGRGGIRPPATGRGGGGGGAGRGRGGGGAGQGGGGPREVLPEEWDAFVMNNLSGAFSYIDERQNEALVEKTQALLKNVENMRIHTVDDDGKKPTITSVSYDPSSAGAPAQGGGGGGNRANPFSQSYQQQEEEYEERGYGGAGGGGGYQDDNLFRDQGYEGGSDARRNSRKKDFEAKLEEMKRSRDMGMPQPIRRV